MQLGFDRPTRLQDSWQQRLSLATKITIAGFLTRPFVGRLVGILLDNRIVRDGVIIGLSDPHVPPEIKAAIYFGFYESAELRFVRRHLRSDLDVLELGSSIGVVACSILARLDASARLVCVEANPRLIPILTANTRMNVSNRELVIVNAAIDYDSPDGSSHMALQADNRASRLIPHSDAHAEINAVVPAETLSSLVERFALHEFCLVVDIEGAEAGMILGDNAGLKGCQQLIIELHDATQPDGKDNAETLLEQLIEEHDFALRERHGNVCFLERSSDRNK